MTPGYSALGLRDLNHVHKVASLVLVDVIVFLTDGADLEHVGKVGASLLQLTAKVRLVGRPVVHDGGVVVAVAVADVTGQGGQGHEVWVGLMQSLLLGMAQEVHHGHPALGIGVTYSQSHSGPGGDNLVGDVRVFSDAIPNHLKEQPWLHELHHS